LFILYLDLVISEVAEGQSTLNILAYANDIAQTALTEEELQHGKWHTTFSKYGLRLNIKKTEVLVLGCPGKQVSIQLGDQTLN